MLYSAQIIHRQASRRCTWECNVLNGPIRVLFVLCVFMLPIASIMLLLLCFNLKNKVIRSEDKPVKKKIVILQ